MFSLKGHTALVTGGTTGVGRAAAESLAEAGADVVLHGLSDDDDAKSAVESIQQRAVQCELITGDLSGETEQCVRDVFSQAVKLRDDIDILVSNAGTYSEPDFLDIDFATFDRTMKLNVYSHYFLIQQFARHWVANGVKGRIVLTGSINGRLAEATHSAYDTSKGAVEMMVRTLCVSLAPHGIRINGMAPGLVRSNLTAGAIDQPVFRDWMELHTPNGCVPDAKVCGPVVAFLASDEAWHVQGQMLLVDGGMSAWQQPDFPPTK